ncbi:coiled-coil domain-containing protein 173 isoform X1 [Carcharodon carcharias]|uniref:coiled-coil domain-containing protein 173 isoform X1 n=1 Tax=Carcharodon carcharias TaxID=13397 RepID=UPI001B7EB5BF|nr:coiled-coil domain-containing protein 173 isoform X1 [Carcharodon carcharias]
MATATNLTPPNRRPMSTDSSSSSRISSVQNINECVPRCHKESDLEKVDALTYDKPSDSGELHFPNLVDLRQVTVLPKAEWQRIQDDLNGINREAEFLHAQNEERVALHLKSKEVTKHWTNTIAGQRQKRLDAGKLRKEGEEAARQQLDIEEAKYMAQKRKESLEQARTLLFYQTDRVKGFNAALMLTEALKEQEAQIELKRKRTNLLKREEKTQMEELQLRINLGEDEEYQKIIKQKEKSKALAVFHQQQIKENEHLKEQEKQQYIKEGEEIKKLANLYQWELNKIEQLKRQEKNNNMMNHKAHVANMNIIKALEKQKEELQDEDIRLFVSAKQKMLKLRKKKQAEIDKEKEDHRKLMIKIISEQMKEEVQDEMHRITKAAQEMEAKREMEIKEKEEKRMADLKAIKEHRIMMMKRREEKEKEEKIQANKILHAKIEADYLHLEQERKKKLKALGENGSVQSFLIEQMAEKKAKALRNRAAELEHEQKHMALLEIEKKQFEEYAQQVIDAAGKKGRNIYPLLKAAHQGIGGGHGPVLTEKGGIRPSYQLKDTSGIQLPNYKRSTTEAVKNIRDKCDIERSKKSLGFIW